MKWRVWCVSVAAQMWWAGVSAAEMHVVNKYCAGPLRVALFEYGVLYRSAKDDGIDTGLLDLLEARTGCTFERVLRPRARIWKELEAGSLDIATAAVPTPERRAYLYFAPYLGARNVVIVRRGSAPGKLTESSLEAGALRMGAVRGFHHEAYYDALVQRMKGLDRVTEASDVEDLLRMLERRVVDVVLSQPVVYFQYLSAASLAKDFDIYDWAPADQYSVGSFVFSKKRFTPEQFKHWDVLVAQLLRDGSVAKVMRQYVGRDQARKMLYTGPRLLEDISPQPVPP